MKLSDIRDEQVRKFSEMMTTLSVTESNLILLIEQEKEKHKLLDHKVLCLKEEEERHKKVGLDLEKQIEKSISLLKKNEREEANLKSIRNDLEGERVEHNLRVEQFCHEEQSLSGKLSDLKKRENWIEIEERRLMYLDKKLSALAQDNEIKEKLKHL